MSYIPSKRYRSHHGNSTRGGRTFRIWSSSAHTVKYGAGVKPGTPSIYEEINNTEPAAQYGDTRSILAVPQSGPLGILSPNVNVVHLQSQQDYLTTATPQSYRGATLANMLFYLHSYNDLGAGPTLNYKNAIHPDMFKYSTWDFKRLNVSATVRRVTFLSGRINPNTANTFLDFSPSSDIGLQLINQQNTDAEFLVWADPTNRNAVFESQGYGVGTIGLFPSYNSPGVINAHAAWSSLINRGLVKRVKHSHGKPAVFSLNLKLKQPSFSWNTYFSQLGDPAITAALANPIADFLTNLSVSAPGNLAMNTGTANGIQMPVDLMNTRTGVGGIYFSPIFPGVAAGLDFSQNLSGPALPTQVCRMYVEYELRTSVTIHCREFMEIPSTISPNILAIASGPLLASVPDIGTMDIEESSSEDDDSVMVVPSVSGKRAHSVPRAPTRH